ncbi:MAG: hypothetical protein ACFB4J_09780, partial [Elainellaceae cyanobacterium]
MADLVNSLTPLSLEEDSSISLSELGANLLADGLGDLNGVTVSITTGFDSAQDELTFAALPATITAAYDDETGVLTLSGTASEADYEAALQAITYANTAGVGDKAIEIAITEFANNGDRKFFDGSFYEFVASDISATAAQSAAANTTFLGEAGFLATITSQAEQDFINPLIAANAWIGGVATEAFEGWVVGPEANQPFTFNNFFGTEPNGGDDEPAVAVSDATTFNFVPLGQWFDAVDDLASVNAYIAEFGGGSFTTSQSVNLEVTEPEPTETPVETPTETPAETPGETPAETPSAPTETPTPPVTDGETPVVDAPDNDGEVFPDTDNTITGTDASEEISGTSDNDAIQGQGGADILQGQAGDDDISGGNGRDLIFGGTGRDRIKGGRSRDYINGNGGADFINGGQAGDTISGGSGDDIIVGGAGNDVLSGNKGDDEIFGNNGRDQIFGNKGNDYMAGGNGR